MWDYISARPSLPNGYLSFAVLDTQNPPLQSKHAKVLLWHCLEREMGAYREIDRAPDGRAHFDATHQLITHRSARTSAEDLLIEAVRSTGAEPVVVRYRIHGRPESTGRLVAADLLAARSETQRLIRLGDRYGLAPQVTSVSHGRSTVAATRVPEIAFAAAYRGPVPVNAPGIAL